MYAAVDIGSNAVRLAILQNKSVESTVIRFPIRLGVDTFHDGQISEKNLKKLIKASQEIQSILSDNGVLRYRAVATSAMRESRNKRRVISEVKKRSRLSIEIIDGHEEACLIQRAVVRELNLTSAPHLIMDIGGGSVEFIAADQGKICQVATLKLGTVRLMGKVNTASVVKQYDSYLNLCEEEFEQLSEIKKFCFKHYSKLAFVGTGGNFRRLKKLNRSLLLNENASPIETEELQTIVDTLMSHSFRDRVERLGLREDRADVILPASALVVGAMQVFGLSRVHVPNSGLKDGVIFDLMEQDQVLKPLQLSPGDFELQS